MAFVELLFVTRPKAKDWDHNSTQIYHHSSKPPRTPYSKRSPNHSIRCQSSEVIKTSAPPKEFLSWLLSLLCARIRTTISSNLDIFTIGLSGSRSRSRVPVLDRREGALAATLVLAASEGAGLDVVRVGPLWQSSAGRSWKVEEGRTGREGLPGWTCFVQQIHFIFAGVGCLCENPEGWKSVWPESVSVYWWTC